MMIAPCRTVREAERAAFDTGLTDSATLMEAVVERLYVAWRDFGFRPQRVVVYAGSGNNAGDALGLAGLLDCPTYLRTLSGEDGKPRLSPEAQHELASCHASLFCSAAPEPAPRTLIIDGLLGSGVRGPLRPACAALIREMNDLRAACPQSLLLAVDIPSGLNPDTGEGAEQAVQADITAPIGCVKPGLLADAAIDAVGRLLPIDLPGIALTPGCGDRVLEPSEPLLQMPRRPYSCFKNRAGRVAVVAGSVGMLGAAQMAAEAAVMAGAGLVALYCLPETYPLLALRCRPEVMVRRVTSYAEIAEPDAKALLIGPGLGQLPEAEQDALLHLADTFAGGPVIMDADGLNMVAARRHSIAPHWILTPHPGEMRRLASELSALPRRELVARFLAAHDCTLLLKGARTIIADRSACYYNSTGGPYMANGGQGDVLSGVIAALAAQGLPALHAAAQGAWRCGRAAERVWVAHGCAGPVPAASLLR